MNEQIIALARQVWDAPIWTQAQAERLEKFAALVAEAEREACAMVCEELSGPIETYNPKYVHYIKCAEQIRNRGAA